MLNTGFTILFLLLGQTLAKACNCNISKLGVCGNIGRVNAGNHLTCPGNIGAKRDALTACYKAGYCTKNSIVNYNINCQKGSVTNSYTGVKC